MVNDKPTLLILAAGLGSRYGSLKQIDRIGPSGERIIDYSVYDAVRAGFGKIVYVIRKSFEDEFNEVILDSLPSSIDTEYVFQEFDTVRHDIAVNEKRTKPWGTGHALLSAASAIKEPFTVINADDFYGANSYNIAYDFLTSSIGQKNNYALVGYKLENTLSDYGTVSRGICELDNDNYMASVTERTKIKRENNQIFYIDDHDGIYPLSKDDVVSMNMFAFQADVFEKYKQSFLRFLEQNSCDLKAEFGLPTVVDELIQNKTCKVKVVETMETWFGLTYREDKAIVTEKILQLVKEGKYPSKLW